MPKIVASMCLEEGQKTVQYGLTAETDDAVDELLRSMLYRWDEAKRRGAKFQNAIIMNAIGD